MAEKHPQYINSIARALEILELYEKTGETWLGIADITAALGIQKTSTFNHPCIYGSILVHVLIKEKVQLVLHSPLI